MTFTVGEIPGDAAYAWNDAQKRGYFLDALNALTAYHRERSAAYRRILDVLGAPAQAERLADVPFLPVRLFKEFALASVGENQIVKTVTSSGTSAQSPSRIVLDRTTAINQTKALARIVSHFTGPKRLPTLIVDSPATARRRNERSARAAGIIGFASLGRNAAYALDEEMNLDEEGVRAFLERFGGEPFLVFGFTSILWDKFYRPLAETGRSFEMERGILFHGGGWKKLQDRSVSNETFKESLRAVGRFEAIHDYYGMAEQTGSIFVECEHGRLHASIFSDVLFRDPVDFSPLPPCRRGLIQLVSLLPASYPGHSILTEDEGESLGVDDCPCGRLGRTFKVIGRIKNAEIRGCSDTL